MKYREQVRNLLTNLDVRAEYLHKIADGATNATPQDAIRLINEIKYHSQKIRELVDLEHNEEPY